MQAQFNILNTDTFITNTCSLAIQLDNESFCYCIYDPEEKKLLELKRYQLSTVTTDCLDIILSQNPILEGVFDKIITSLDFGFSTLLPQQMSNGDYMPLMYFENANLQDHIISEVLNKWQITNIYTTPPEILTWMVHHFPSSNYLHALSVYVQSINEFSEEGVFRLHIYERHFDVTVFKGNQLLLSKRYTYQTPQDIIFYLLKICETFNFSQETVQLQVSGLIDEDSKLFRIIYEYFVLIYLKPATWIDNISGLPIHYFTSLNELILCESLQEV